MIDVTICPSTLRSLRRIDPVGFKQDLDDLIAYVRHARGAVTHNVTLMANVRKWEPSRDKDRNLATLRDNIDGWRAKTNNAVRAIRARRAA